MRAEFTADFMSDPNYVKITCTICNETENIPTTGIAPSGIFAGQRVLRDSSAIDKEVRKFRQLHEKAHKE